MGFSRQEHWSGLPFPSPVDHILSELCTMTRPSWVALPYGMAHSFIELDKAVVHLIRLVSFLWVWFSVCLPSDGNSGNSGRLYFLGLQNHCRWWLQSWNKKTLTPWKKNYNQHRQHVKKQRHYFANKGLSSQDYGFSSSHVWMWELDFKENWATNNWCFWTVVLEKTLQSPLDCKDIQPVHPKGHQSCMFIGRTDFEAESPILWPSDAKSWLIGKSPDAWKDWGQEEKGTTEDEMVGWHHRLNGHEFE